MRDQGGVAGLASAGLLPHGHRILALVGLSSAFMEREIKWSFVSLSPSSPHQNIWATTPASPPPPSIWFTFWGFQGNLYGFFGVCNLRAKTAEVSAVRFRSLEELRSNMSGLCAPWTKNKARASRWYGGQSGELRPRLGQACRSKGWSELASWLWVLWTDKAWTGVFRKT